MDLFFPHEDRDRLDFKNSAMLVGFEELTAECMANIHLLQPHDRLAVLLIAWKKIGEFLTGNLYTHSLGSVVCWVGKYTLELWFGRDWIVCTAENKSTLIDHMMKVYPAAYVLMHPYCWAHMFTIYNDPWMVEYLNFNFQRMNGSIEPPQILDTKDSEFIHREGISLILLRVIHMFEFRMLKLVKYLCVRLLWAYEDKKSSAYKMLHATPNAAEYMDYVRHVYLISICEFNGTSDLHFLIECIQRNCHCALSETETLHKSAQTIAEGLQSSKNTLSNFFNTFILKTRERKLNNAFGSAVNKYLIFITEYQLKKLFALSSSEFTPAWEAIYQKLIRMFLIQRESSEELMKSTKDVAEKLFFGVRNLKSLTFAYEQVKQLTRPEWYTSKIGLLLSIITRKLNILEEFKFISNKTVEELLKMEQDLSNYYRDFAKLLVKAPYLEQEAWLTTFSLHPCKDYMDAVTKCGSRNLRAIKKQAIKIKAIPGPEPKPPIKVEDKLINIIKEETDKMVQMETNDILSPTTTPLVTVETKCNEPSTSAALLEAKFKQPSTSAAFLAAIQASAGLNEKKIVEPKTEKGPKKRGPRSKYNKKDKVEKKKLTNSGIKSGGRGRPIGSTKIKSEMIKNLDTKLVKTATLKKSSVTATKPEAKESKFKDLAEAIYSAAAGAADDISTKTVESIKYPSFALMNSVTDTEELIKYTDYDDQITQYHELNRILNSLRLKHCHYDDILALIIYPRYKRLTWATTWRNLKKRCRDLLNKENKKVLLVQQYMADANDRLTHLNIDYDKYKDKPQIDYGSIEDGYECFDSESDDELLQPAVVNSISTKEGDTSSPKTAKRRKRTHPIKPPLKYTELSIKNSKGNDDKLTKEASNGVTKQTENVVPSIMNTLKTSLSTPIYLNQPVYIVRRPTDNSSTISPQILANNGGKGAPITVNSIETISSPLLNIKTPINLSPGSDSNALENQENPRISPTFSLVSGNSMQMQPQCKLITIKNQPNIAYTLNQPLNLHSTNCIQPSESLNYTNQNPLNKSTVCPYVPQLTVVTAPQPSAIATVRYKSNSQSQNLQTIPKQSHIDTTETTKSPVSLKPSSSTSNISGSEDQPEDLTMPKKTTCMLPIKLAKPPQNLPLNLTARTSSMLTNTDDLAAIASESELTGDNDIEDENIHTDSSQKSTNKEEKCTLPLQTTGHANDQQETFYQISSASDSTLNNSHLKNNDNANIIYDLTTTNIVPDDVQHKPKQQLIGNDNENYDKQEPKKKEDQQALLENGPRQILAPTTSNNISQLNDVTELGLTIAEGEKTKFPNILNLQYGNSIKIIPGPGSVALVTTGNSGTVLKGQGSPTIIEHLVLKDNVAQNKPIYRIGGKIVDMVNVPGSGNAVVQNSNVPKVVALTTRKIISVRGTGNPPVIAPSRVPLTDAVGRVLTVGSKFSLTPEGVKMCEAARKARHAEAEKSNGSPPQTAENLTVETKSATIVTMEMPKVPICLSIQKSPQEPTNVLLTTLTSPISTSAIAPQNEIHIVRSTSTAESAENKNINKMLQLSIETTNSSSQVTNKLQPITESSNEKRVVSPSSKNTPQLIPGTSKEIIIKWSPPKNKSEPISVTSSPPKNTSEQISQATRGIVVTSSPAKNTSELISQPTTTIKKIASSPPKNTSELITQSSRAGTVATSPPRNTPEITTQSSRSSIVATSPPKNTPELITQSNRSSIVATSPPKNISEPISQPTTILKTLAWSPPKKPAELVLEPTTAKIVASFPPKNSSNPILQATAAKVVASFPSKNTINPISQATPAKIVAPFPPKKTSEPVLQVTTAKIVEPFAPKNTSESISVANKTQIVATTPSKNILELTSNTSKEKKVELSPNKNTSELISKTSGEKIIASFSPKNNTQPTREKPIEKIVTSSPLKNKLQSISESSVEKILVSPSHKNKSQPICESSTGNKAVSPSYKSQPTIVTSVEKTVPSPPHKNTSQLISVTSKEKIVASSSPKNISQPIQESSIGKVQESSIEKTTISTSFKEKPQTNLVEDLSVDVTTKPLREDQIVAKNAITPFNMLPSSSKITISQPIAHKSTSPPKKDNNVNDNVKILYEGILTNDSRAPINDTTVLETENKDMNATLKLLSVEKIPLVVNLTKEDDPKIDQSLPNTSQSTKSLIEDLTTNKSSEDMTQIPIQLIKFPPFCPDEWDSDLSRPDTPVDLTLDSDTQSQGEAPIHEILNDKDKVFNNNLLDPHLKTYKNVKGFPKIEHNDPCTSRRVLRIRKGLRAVIKDIRFNVKNFPLEAKNPPQVITYMEVDTDNEQPMYDDNSQSSMMSFYDPLDIHTTNMINSFRKPISLKRQLSPICYSPVAVKRPSLDKDACEAQIEDSLDLYESSSDDETEGPRSMYNPVVTPITPMVSDTDEMQSGTEEKGKLSLKRPSLSKDVCEAQTEDSVDLFGSSTEAETDRQISFYNIFSAVTPTISGTDEMQSEAEDTLARITLKPSTTDKEEKVALKRLSLGKNACEAPTEDSVDLFESSTEAETEVQRLRLFNLYSPITPMVSDIDEMQSEAEDTSAKLSPKTSSTEEKVNTTTNLIELIQEVTGAKKFNPESQIIQLVTNETKNQTNEENNSQNKVTHIGIGINDQSNEEGNEAITSMFPDGPRKVGEYWAYAQIVDQTPENLERVNKIFNKLKTTVQLDTTPVPPSTTQATTEIEFKPLSVPIRRMIMRARYVVFNQAYINEREKFVAEVAKQGLMEKNEDSSASILIARFIRDKSLNDDSLISLLQKQVGSDGGERLSSALIGVVLKVTMSGAALRRNINVDENEQPVDNQQQNGREKVDASTTLHEFYLEKRAEVGSAMYSPIISLNKLLDGTLEESVPIPRECLGSDEEEEKLSVSLNDEQIKKTTPATDSETSVGPTVVEKRPKRKIQTRKQAGTNVPITRRASLRSLNKNQSVSTLCRSISPSGSTQDSKKPLSQEESEDNTDAELDIIYECATMSTANDSEDDTGSEYEPRTTRPKVVKPMRLRCIGRRSTNRVEFTTESSSCSSSATAQQRTRQFAAKSTSSHRTRRSQLLMEATTRNTIQGLSAADKAALLHYKCVDVEVRLNRLTSREAEMCRKPVIKLERHAAIGKYLKIGQNQEVQQNNNETDDESIYSENLDDEENEADDESEDMDKDEFKKKPTPRRHSLVSLRKEFIRNLKNKTANESESCNETKRKPTRVAKKRSAELNQHEQNLREQQPQVSGKNVVNTRQTTPLLSESSGTEEEEEKNDEITSNCSSKDNDSDDDDDDDDDDDGNGNGNAGRVTSRASISGTTTAGSSNNATTSSSKQSTANTNEPPSTSRKRGNMRSHICNTASENSPIPIPKKATKNGNNVESPIVINSSSEEDTTNAAEGPTNIGGTGDRTEPTTAPPTEDTGARSVTLAQIIRILRENLITTGSRHLSSKPAVPECVFHNSVAESITATIHPPTETSAQRVEISHNLAPVDVIDRLRDIIRRTLARLTVVERNSERRLARQRRQQIRNDRIARNNENIRQLRLLEERLNERVSRRRSLSSSSESRCSTPELPSCQDPRRYRQFYPDYGQSGASSPAYSTPEY